MTIVGAEIQMGGGEGDCFARFTGLKNDHEGITAINIKFLRFV